MAEIPLGAITLTFVVIIAFFAGNAIIGVYERKRAAAWVQYAIGGRSFGVVFVGFFILSTWWPGVVFTGFVGLPLLAGGVGMYAALYSTFTLGIYYALSGRTWRAGKIFDLKTQGALMGHRYNSRAVQFLFGLFGNVFHFPWLIIEILSLGIVFNFATYGLVPMWLAMLIGLIVIWVYVGLSGYVGAITAGAIQGIIVTFGAITLLFIVAQNLFGGYGAGLEALHTDFGAEFVTTKIGASIFGPNYFSSIILASMIGGWAWPTMFIKIYSANSVKSVKQAILFAPFLAFAFGSLLFMLAMLGHMVPEALARPDIGLFEMVLLGAGPAGITLLCLIVIAAVFGTWAAIVQCNAVMVSEDMVKFFRPKLTEKGQIMAARITIILQGVIAYAFALVPGPMLIFYAIAAYQGIVQIFPALLFGLFWQRTNKYGAIIGMLVGAAIAVPLTLMPQFLSGGVAGGVTIFGGWTGGIVGLTVNTAIVIIAGLLKKPEPHVKEFFASYKTKI